MAEFFMGQIMMTGFGFAPKFFAQCNGQLMQVNQSAALFALLGTYYGGDGVKTFGLPDLRSRTPAGGGFPSLDPAWLGQGYALGQIAGTEQVTLLAGQLPLHTHIATVTSAAGTGAPGPRQPGLTLAANSDTAQTTYGAVNTPIALGGAPLTPTGGSQPHPNIQPYEAINFNIALTGIFPSRG